MYIETRETVPSTKLKSSVTMVSSYLIHSVAVIEYYPLLTYVPSPVIGLLKIVTDSTTESSSSTLLSILYALLLQ